MCTIPLSNISHHKSLMLLLSNATLINSFPIPITTSKSALNQFNIFLGLSNIGGTSTGGYFLKGEGMGMDTPSDNSEKTKLAGNIL